MIGPKTGEAYSGTALWQRNYWDDIIRGYGSYERITEYIRNNPANWRKDDFHG
jgi:REP element-mobilizing transposase RayT